MQSYYNSHLNLGLYTDNCNYRLVKILNFIQFLPVYLNYQHWKHNLIETPEY